MRGIARAGRRAALIGCAALAVTACERAPAPTPAADDGTVKVHVNQVVLDRSGPKSAIVESTGSAAGGRFAVVADGRIVRKGELTALPAFDEWGTGKKYFEADFSSLDAAGAYRVEATLGGSRGESAPFRVDDRATFRTTVSAVLDYFRASRYTNEADRRIRIFDTQRYVDVWGGWKDAGGDNGKYLSHLSYANFFNPQQTALVAWALAKSYATVPDLYKEENLDGTVIAEVLWGADYLHRLLDPEGYFYLTVFDRWGEPGAERMVVGYVGIDGVYTKGYKAGFREGAGIAIAALARASQLSKAGGAKGEFPAQQYLADARKGFAHLEQHNLEYVDDGKENIIDDYTALVAATELHEATGEAAYLESARRRADNLNERMTKDGWFISDDGSRPYYHGAEAGFPVVALVYYLDIERDAQRIARVRETIRTALEHQLALDRATANPFNYARQNFRIYKEGKPGDRVLDGFFMPHANETGYWWQGESARLSSLATAAVLGGRLVAPDRQGAYGVRADLARFAQNQLDWTLGRNPYDICLLYGFGARNVPDAESAGQHVKGGISNGITGATPSDEGRGIDFAPGPDENNWRWLEQWLPHSTWFLLAASAMAARD
jgi:hypothetical protein